MNRKSLLTVVLAIVTLCAANAALATKGRAVGVPLTLMANSTHSTYFDSFDITGLKAFGTCPVDSATGFVSVSMANATTGGATDSSANRIFALALAAEEAGRPLTVDLDDSVVDANGICIAIWVWM